MQASSRARARIVSVIERDAASSGFSLTAEQREALPELLRVADDLRLGSASPRGVYLWGSAGRGKSWLIDAFFRALPEQKKTRVHFHGFLDAVQRRIYEHRPAPDAAQRAIGDLIGGARVVYFDEFHVHDSGDAVLLTRLLEHLASAGTVLLATSNYPPDELMSDSPWRYVFDSALDLIDASMRTVRMGGGDDLREAATDDLREAATDDVRRRTGEAMTKSDRGRAFARGSWIVVDTPNASRDGDTALVPQPDESVSLRVGSRLFDALAVRGDHLWIGFDQLCVVPTSPIEYLDWAQRFSRWTIVGVPAFTSVDREAQQRFITVIDVLADAGVATTIVSPLGRAAFSESAGARQDANRMLSRLRLLREVRPAEAPTAASDRPRVED